jgi:tetratricopeptide (TPR) repeat protein
MRRAQAYEKLEDLESALGDWKKVLEIDPLLLKARSERYRLESTIKERNEKMKDEMLGKLKDLGNTVLGKFGMSLDNFNAVKDPNTGSYSISYGQG